MKIEETFGDQRRVGELIFQILQELGCSPEFDITSKWYKVRYRSKPIFVWLCFVKESTRRYPPNSVRLVASQSEEMADSRFDKGNNFFGPDFNVVARPESPQDVALAIEFLCKAFQVNHQRQIA